MTKWETIGPQWLLVSWDLAHYFAVPPKQLKLTSCSSLVRSWKSPGVNTSTPGMFIFRILSANASCCLLTSCRPSSISLLGPGLSSGLLGPGLPSLLSLEAPCKETFVSAVVSVCTFDDDSISIGTFSEALSASIGSDFVDFDDSELFSKWDEQDMSVVCETSETLGLHSVDACIFDCTVCSFWFRERSSCDFCLAIASNLPCFIFSFSSFSKISARTESSTGRCTNLLQKTFYDNSKEGLFMKSMYPWRQKGQTRVKSQYVLYVPVIHWCLITLCYWITEQHKCICTHTKNSSLGKVTIFNRSKFCIHWLAEIFSWVCGILFIIAEEFNHKYLQWYHISFVEPC